jgi:hypothetical protein
MNTPAHTDDKRSVIATSLIDAPRRLRERGELLPLLRTSALILALGGLLLLAGCTLFNGGSGTAASPSQVPWCDAHSSPAFQDNSTSAHKVLNSWADVKDQLGFTVYLPTSLPKGTCLALAGGTIHDPIFGGSFQIAYTLPNNDSMAFSEAPRAPNLSNTVQCTQSGSDAKITICEGAINGTGITIAARETQQQLQSVFSSLQPNVDWVPQVTAAPSAPTNTPATTPVITPTSH